MLAKSITSPVVASMIRPLTAGAAVCAKTDTENKIRNIQLANDLIYVKISFHDSINANPQSDFLDYTARVSDGDHIVRNILGYYRACAYCDIVAYAYARKYGNAPANPYIVSD